MAQTPPPPEEGSDLDFQIPTPMRGRPTRPAIITAAAAIFFVQGAFGLLLGVLAFSLKDSTRTAIQPSGAVRLTTTLGAVYLVVGALNGVAGLLVLRLRAAGRILGFVLAGVGILSGLYALSKGSGFGLVTLLLFGLVMFALATTGDVFARARQG